MAALKTALLEWEPLAAALDDAEIDRLERELLDKESGFMARGDVLSHARLITEVAPLLYGHDPAELTQVVGRIRDRGNELARHVGGGGGLSVLGGSGRT